MQTLANKKVAIIGAGLAGLSCATRLQQLGCEVEIFEKSRGPSGRMSTRQGDGWVADHGAQYFTARDPLFIDALDSWIHEGVVSLWNPKMGVYENGQWHEHHSHEKRFVALPGMNALGKYLANHLTLHANQTIDQLIPINHQWQIHSKEFGLINSVFDYLVLAIPAPQASALTQGHANEIQSVCNLVNMNGCWTVMARFTDQPKFPFDAAFVNGEKISWICRNQSKPQRDGKESWTIHASPQWSQEHIELNENDANAQLLQCAQNLGFDYRSAEISTHRWRYASGYAEGNPEFFFLPELNFGLCGDWLHSGRVEGAWLSGRKLADQIMNQQRS